MSVEVPPEAMEAAIRAMAEAAQDPEEIGPRLFSILGRQHDKRIREGTWDGDPSKTAAAEGRKGLLKTGRLQRSLSGPSPDAVREIQGNLFTFGTTLPYARYLTDGAVIVPRFARNLKFKVAGEWKTKDLVILPAREFIGFLRNDEIEEVNEFLQAWLLQVGRDAARAAGGDLDITGAKLEE